MQTHILGYPRIGSHRELKKACEKFWAGTLELDELVQTGKKIRQQNWQMQKEAGIDLIPCNDFSFYDQVLDMTLTLGAVPPRYRKINAGDESELYFAMARGYQKNGADITAMEMTKWFDTNYHYIVPEFHKDQEFRLNLRKIMGEFTEAKNLGIQAKPILIGPISYLLLGKEKEANFDRLDLIERLLPVYLQILEELYKAGAEWVQLDEPFLTTDIPGKARKLYEEVYREIRKKIPHLSIILATYFGDLEENTSLATSLPVEVLHIDLCRAPAQLDRLLNQIPDSLSLSLGIVDGRNIWKNDFDTSLSIIKKAASKIGAARIFLAPSCSLLHVPCDLSLETDDVSLPAQIKNWMAFARQKVMEIIDLKDLALGNQHEKTKQALAENRKAAQSRKHSALIHRSEVQQRTAAIIPEDSRRKSPFAERSIKQQQTLDLPLFPTTTIGSFPQTKEIRTWRSKFRKGEISAEEYHLMLKQETQDAIRRQEKIGLDVLVHGEFERNDMVEYFGEQLEGFAFTKNGWVQSYGSRCVKPPIIFGDISRPHPMTVYWAEFAQSLTSKPVKGMLTGPVTILQWSFVRDDQPREQTCKQIALAIREEVCDLETAGIRIIQIDEPAIREGLPLRKRDWQQYLDWAVECFRISSSAVSDETQIHTHMCYSEFNDIIRDIAAMDADVITIECSRSQMDLLNAFADFRYPNEIGPGVYDIHSPRVPSREEMVSLLKKAATVIPAHQLWVNPDCGLKTRHWEETEKALRTMVEAAHEVTKGFTSGEKHNHHWS